MSDIIIIGGGVLGLLSARELAASGARVTLLERGETGRESSWAGGGIVSPLYPWRYAEAVSALAGWSQQHYPGLAGELIADTGIDPEFYPCGLLILAADEQDTALAWAMAHQRRLHIIDRREVRALEPAMADPAESAIWMPGIANLRNPRLAESLHADLRRRGVRLETRTEVTGLVSRAGRIERVTTSRGDFQADNVVLCAGAWTAQLLQDLAPAPAIEPVRGQMLLFRTAPNSIRRMVLEDSRYVIPRRDGRVLFGSTIEHTGFDKSVTETARAELLTLATQRFPLLADAELERHWAGLRPASPAGIPYICRHPEQQNLYINAGHFRNGIVLGPASARLLADLVLQRPPILDPTPYALDAARD